MQQISLVVIVVLCAWMAPAVSQGGDFVPYPWATPDDKMSAASTKYAAANGVAGEVLVFTSKHVFDKVVAFYTKAGKVYDAPWVKVAGKLPDGRDIVRAIILLDDAEDLSKSNRWVQIQYPFIGDVEMIADKPRYKDVREVTSIIYTHKKE